MANKLRRLLVLFIILQLLEQSVRVECARYKPQKGRGTGKAFGAGILAGGLAGAAMGHILTRPNAPQEIIHHHHVIDPNAGAAAAIPAAVPNPVPQPRPSTIIERGETYANGCYNEIIREPDMHDPTRFIETSQLRCPQNLSQPAPPIYVHQIPVHLPQPVMPVVHAPVPMLPQAPAAVNPPPVHEVPVVPQMIVPAAPIVPPPVPVQPVAPTEVNPAPQTPENPAELPPNSEPVNTAALAPLQPILPGSEQSTNSTLPVMPQPAAPVAPAAPEQPALPIMPVVAPQPAIVHHHVQPAAPVAPPAPEQSSNIVQALPVMPVVNHNLPQPAIVHHHVHPAAPVPIPASSDPSQVIVLSKKTGFYEDDAKKKNSANSLLTNNFGFLLLGLALLRLL